MPSGLLEPLLSLAPLREGYAFHVSSYDKWGDAIHETDLVVRGSATVIESGRSREAWVIEEVNPRVTHLKWYARDSSLLLQAHDRHSRAATDDEGFWTVRAHVAALLPDIHGGNPAVSPDGNWIAFVSNRTGASEVYLVGADGSNERQLPRSGGWKGRTGWTADGRVLFTTGSNDTSRVYAISPAGGEPTLLATVPGRAATLSPDGTRVLYAVGPWEASYLVVSALDGSGAQRLTSGISTVWSGRWSSDGEWIAFEQTDGGSMNVWMIQADGTSGHRMTAFDSTEGNPQLPAWSAEGKLAFQVSGPAPFTGHIWVLDEHGNAPVQLAPHTAFYADEIPVWFPDETRLAFQSDRTGRTEIWVMDADGTNARQLTR